MSTVVAYGSRERAGLVIIALGGLIGLNGVFVYSLIVRPEVLVAAMSNPVSLAFIVEALVMTGVLAYLLHKWGVSRLSWVAFVALALVGGLAFAVPIAALWKGNARPVQASGTGALH
jgi:hypothetical protein